MTSVYYVRLEKLEFSGCAYQLCGCCLVYYKWVIDEESVTNGILTFVPAILVQYSDILLLLYYNPWKWEGGRSNY